MERARDAQAKAGLISALPDELLARVFTHLPSIHDFGRADGVCRAWRARGSPVEQALREHIEARDGAEQAPGADATTQRMCFVELLREARMTSGLVSASDTMSAAVDADEQLHVWGKIYVHGDNKICSFDEPTVLPMPHGTRVQCVSVGWDHVLVLTETGEVLSFGWGGHGRLGHGLNVNTRRKPKVIEALRGVRVVAIAAGMHHTMVLTDEGKVLSFGNGHNGTLGHGDEAVQCVPKVIADLRALRS